MLKCVFILTNGVRKMKKVLTAVALMAMTTTANATDIGMGIDRETKYKKGEGTTVTYNYAFIQHKWKDLGGITTKATHSQNAETNTTNYNELKISKDFKFNVAGDSKNAFKIVPSFQRRWDGQEGIGEKSKDNFKVEFKYTF